MITEETGIIEKRHFDNLLQKEKDYDKLLAHAKKMYAIVKDIPNIAKSQDDRKIQREFKEHFLK